MPPKADPFVQRRLLDVARIDQAASAAAHRRTSLPELALIASGHDHGRRAAQRRGAAPRPRSATWTGPARKLDNEIDAVRLRAKRDADRLAAGTAPAKDLENMQHEIVSLARRQATLEDEALELMERREVADTALAATERELTIARAELEAAAAASRRRVRRHRRRTDSGSPPSARSCSAGCRPTWSRCTNRSGRAAGSRPRR